MTRRIFIGTGAATLCWWMNAPRAPAVETGPARVAVESSSLAAVGYDAATQRLDIEFHSGALYRYREVPAAVFAELMKVESKGRYFAQRIRGKFNYERIRKPAK